MPSSEIFAAQLCEQLLEQSNSKEAASRSPDEPPSPDSSVHHVLAPATLTTYTPLGDPNIAQPFPLPPRAPGSLSTPESAPDFDILSLSFAPSARLTPTDISLPLPSPPAVVKKAHDLRLPSFETLGIANPHPDRITNSNPFSPLGAGPLSNPADPLHALSPPPNLPLAHPQHFGGVVNFTPESPEPRNPLITPPTEPGTINWGSLVNLKTAGLGSPPQSEAEISPSLNTITGESTADPAGTTNQLTVADLCDALDMAGWVGTVKSTITSNFQSHHSDNVKILSHALPCPSTTGHIFSQIISDLHERSPTPIAWINVFHAVPGRYTLEDLPKSPPSTPGPAIGGEAYFTSKVFDSAVAVPDYQLESKLLPLSPRPVVCPGSVNVSIVERYIPPTNANEFSDMFKLRGPSLLVDRLIELSFHNGLLMFIYPTKTGGKTFMNEYLGPILDPLLRSVTVVHELTSDLGKTLGQMTAVERLLEYEALHSEMEKLCGTLSKGQPNLTSSPERRATYTILHASKEEAVLERQAWAVDWWIKQEKSRVRELVNRFLRKKLPNSELTPTTLIQEVLDGVAHREDKRTTKPKGVEVAVFIVQKTSA